MESWKVSREIFTAWTENWRGRDRVPAVLPPGKEENDYGVDPLIDRCGAVIGNQKTPVFPEKRFGWNGIDGQKLPDRPSIRVSGIFRHILFS